jgi:hypothetical protein
MAQYQAGFNMKGRINSTAWAFATCQWRDTADDLDVTNTENIPGNPALPGNVGIGARAVITGIQHLEATIRSATFDVLSNIFAAPFGLNPSTYIDLRVFMNGAAGVSIQSPSFFIREASIDGDVNRLEPVSFSGTSDGLYSIPAT